ncbi:MAG: hypothetical protein A3F83_11660, partial [Candidatus Glassbacteria bacterium RIFCSPLOWO2_12_FULL_58_11]
MPFRRIAFLLLLALLPAARGLSSAQNRQGKPAVPQPPDTLRQERTEDYKTAWATRVLEPPLVDGYPEDSCWALALPVRGFTQRRPDEGENPTEETVVRIVYDNESIYFLFVCYDSEPDKIDARLTPRDNIQSSDNVRIWIDSFFDRRTAFQFAVNPLNVQEDELWTEDTGQDINWNGVWFSSARKLDYGWVAEIGIPFSVLRFGGKPFQTWGLNLSRYIERKKEYNQWRMIPESDSGFFVSRFGMLGGLEGLRTPHRLELLPYGTAQLQDNSVIRNDFTSNAGLDLKYGLNSGVTLDLALNPEFGTVETDEEQLNLSPFPTYYPEKRPFFLEFQDIFRTDMPLVHTRRIGKPLGNVVDPTSTILSGARLVGKTENGLRYGLIEGLTDEEKYYYIDENRSGGFDAGLESPYRKYKDIPLEMRGKATEVYLDPRSNYMVGRLLKEYEDGSSLGLIATGVNRAAGSGRLDIPAQAYTGGIDWDFKFNRTWSFAGQLAGSSVEKPEGGQLEGYGLELKLHKFNGEHFTYGIDYDRYSDRFNVNDLGWLYGNDYGTHNLNTDFQFRDRPHAHGVRSFSVYWRMRRNWTDRTLQPLVGRTLGDRFNPSRELYTNGALSVGDVAVGGELEFMNYWSVSGGARSGFDKEEDPFRASKAQDFIFSYPRTLVCYGNLSNNSSSPFTVNISQNYGSFRDGTRWREGITFRLRPNPRLELSLNAVREKTWDFSDFGAPVKVAGTQVPDEILSLRKTRFNSLIFRTGYALNNKLDFRLFAQYTDFGSRRYQPLLPGPFEFETPRESRSTLGLHFVTRFEYRPGSY